MHLPPHLRRYLRSGSARALGPDEDAKSGIDFMVRTIGRHGGKQAVPKNGGSGDEASSDEEDSDDGAPAPMVPSAPMAEPTSVEAADLATMSIKQLRTVVGDQAPAYANVMFQHSSRMTPLAKFRPADSLLVLTNERGAQQPFRKGQVDASVFYHAIVAAVETSNAPIAANDAFVNFTGGAPECLVAAIAAGFRTVFHIASSPDEVLMMQLPGEEVERNLNYMKYTSPEPWPRLEMHPLRHVYHGATIPIGALERWTRAVGCCGAGTAPSHSGLRCPSSASSLLRRYASCQGTSSMAPWAR